MIFFCSVYICSTLSKCFDGDGDGDGRGGGGDGGGGGGGGVKCRTKQK